MLGAGVFSQRGVMTAEISYPRVLLRLQYDFYAPKPQDLQVKISVLLRLQYDFYMRSLYSI
jgi:hypothetical protein